MQAVMMSSNECSKLKSFQRISFYDQDHLDLCKKGHFWCQYPNGSSIFEGEAAFEDVNGLCRKKNAKFVKPDSKIEMQKIYDRKNETFARFWTPIKRMSSTTFDDDGVIKDMNDSSTYFNLNLILNDGDALDAKRWDRNLSSTAYKILSGRTFVPDKMPFVDYMYTNETRVFFSVRNALIKPFFENSEKRPNAFAGCLCKRTDTKMIHPGILTVAIPFITCIFFIFIYISCHFRKPFSPTDTSN